MNEIERQKHDMLWETSKAQQKRAAELLWSTKHAIALAKLTIERSRELLLRIKQM